MIHEVPLTSDVVVLSWNEPASQDHNVRKIAEFLGATVRSVSLTAAAVRAVDSIARLVPPCRCLVVNVEALAQASNALEGGVNGLHELVDLAEHVLIHGFQAADHHSSILKALSSGRYPGLQPIAASHEAFRVADRHRRWCGPFSGLSLGAADPRRDASLLRPVEQEQAVLIQAGDNPFFVRVDHGKTDLFFLACSEFADLEARVPGEAGLLPWFPTLVPLMMFLRGALGTRLWHNDQPRACFIIDDPLLKRRYGYLEYGRLVDAMRRARFSASIAFIPWNYRRSRKEIAKLFADRSGLSSVCVHGCDHTWAEFGTMEFESLCGKAQLALDRMRAHQRLSGVVYDEIMVFPQGIFSSAALRALKACGYLAAVNTGLCPSNLPGALTLGDLLEVAITRFEDFPLFGRRYPGALAEFAFDLFLGKPLLAVEHHGYFRNGYQDLETFVQRLHALDARLEWTDLTTICSHASLTRTSERGDVQVRFYANRFSLENRGTESQTYVLTRRQAPAAFSPLLRIGTGRWHSTQHDDHIEIHLSLAPGQAADITLAPGPPYRGSLSPKPHGMYSAKVLMRRVLCEFRDNYVDTNRVLRGLHQRMTTIMSGASTALAETDAMRPVGSMSDRTP